jgi:hypothetical protein
MDISGALAARLASQAETSRNFVGYETIEALLTAVAMVYSTPAVNLKLLANSEKS